MRGGVRLRYAAAVACCAILASAAFLRPLYLFWLLGLVTSFAAPLVLASRGRQTTSPPPSPVPPPSPHTARGERGEQPDPATAPASPHAVHNLSLDGDPLPPAPPAVSTQAAKLPAAAAELEAAAVWEAASPTPAALTNDAELAAIRTTHAAAMAAYEAAAAAVAPHVAKLRAVLTDDGLEDISDPLAARFLAANDHRVEKAAAQYRAYVSWRAHERVDDISQPRAGVEESTPPHLEALIDLHGFMFSILDGPDREGRPVVVLHVGALDPARLRRGGVTRQMVLRRHIQLLEAMQSALDAAPNPHAGCLIILDVHAGEATVKRCGYFLRAIPLIMQMARVGQANYPELAGKLAVLRGPNSHFLRWGVNKGRKLCDPRTAEKFVIFQGPSPPEAREALRQLLPATTRLPKALQTFPWPLPTTWLAPEEEVAAAR